MAFKIGTQILLKNGKRGIIEAAFGHAECREYKVRSGHKLFYFVEDELLAEINNGRYRFDMTLESHVR